MEFPVSFLNKIKKALSESIDFRSMIHLTKEIIPDYDIHQRTNTPESLSITRVDAANQIIMDMHTNNLIIPFLNVLLKIQFEGYKGRKYKISGLNDLLKAAYDLGFLFDKESGLIFEHPKYRVTKNWSVLQEGMEYMLCFLWIDIIKFSRLVKRFSENEIKKTHHDFKHIVRTAVEKRYGRIWAIYGDGILAAFNFFNKSQCAMLSAMEILHTLHDYNRISTIIDEPLEVIISLEIGNCVYLSNPDYIKECETIQNAINAEKYTPVNHIRLSKAVKTMLDDIISQALQPEGKEIATDYYLYKMCWE